MNVPKKSSSCWILCASKSFPGKSYYFNLNTGEAVWTLNDHEKSILKKENSIQKITSKQHNYPEPTTHPDQVTDLTVANTWPNAPTSNHWQDYQQFSQYPPIFNQYMPMPNTVMMPMQWPTQIWPYMPQDIRRPTIDKITQTSQIESNLFVQASSMPMCKRFVNYETPLLAFGKETKINKFGTCNKMSKEVFAKHSPIKCIPATNLDAEIRSATKSVDSFQKMGISGNLDFDKSYVDKRNLNYDCNVGIDQEKAVEESRRKNLANLDRCDLRFLLEAKKRKLLGKISDSIDLKKTKIEGPVTPPRKTVLFDEETYNLDNNSDDFKGITSVPANDTNTKSLHIHSDTTRNINNMPEHDTPSEIMATESMDTNITSTEPNIPISTRNTMPTITHFDTENKYPMKLEDIESYVSTNNDPTEPNATNYSNIDISSNCSLHEDLNRNEIATAPVETNDRPLKECSSSYTVKSVWYIVTDLNVLLEDHAVVEKILESYEACRLLLPYCLRSELDATCIGDSRGQQRVLVARQINRRFSGHRQYIVEPPSFVNKDNMDIPDGILNCCIRAIKNNDYVVLITNDPHLLARARAYNIRRYTTQEIKNGAIIKPKSFSELKRLVVKLDNIHTEESDPFIKNKLSDIFSKRENVYNTDINKKHDDNDCDILINITKPKSRNINENNGNDDNVSTVDISNQMKILNITNTNIESNQLSQNQKDSQTHNQNLLSTNIDFETDIPFKSVESSNIYSQNQATNKFNFRSLPSKSNIDIKNISKPINTITSKYFQNSNSEVIRSLNPEANYFKQNVNINQNLKLTTSHNQHLNKFGNVLSKINFNVQNSENPFTSASLKAPHSHADNKKDPITTSVKINTISEIENGEKDTLHECNSNMTTAARRRIEKIITSINPNKNKIDAPQNQLQPKEIKADDLFKIPKAFSLKKGSIFTSTPKQGSGATDQIRSNFKKSTAVEDGLNNFCMKYKILLQNVKPRMDEWICVYTQIMEELLRDIFQLNIDHTRDQIVSPINLHESLTCIKMLYDNGRLREIVEVLVDLITKYSCGKGKLSLDITPQDFLRMIGCAVLFVETLKTILSSPILLDYENYLASLLHNMENQRIELDPEFLRPTNICRSEMSDANTGIRFNYRKDRAYVVNYLKKHFKAWSEYNENTDSTDIVEKNSSNQEDFKVVRMIGKNISMLKIDNKKSLSYTKNITNSGRDLKHKGGTKIIRFIENKQPDSCKENVNIESKNAGSNLRKCILKSVKSKEDQSKINNIDTQNIIKDIETITDINLSAIAIMNQIKQFENHTRNHLGLDEENFTTKHIVGKKYEITAPKAIRNVESIETVKNKEPLDVDMLDFSEINTTQRHNPEKSNEKDEISFKDLGNLEHGNNKNSNKNLNTKICSNNENHAADNGFHASSRNQDQHKNEDHATRNEFNASLKNYPKITFDNTVHEDGISESNYEESLNIQDIFGSRGNHNINYPKEDRFNENYATTNIDYVTISDDYAIGKVDSGIIDEHYAICDSSYDKNEYYAAIQMTPKDDSMNDSGFESMSTQAYAVIKLFLSELGTTFKIVYEFISNVADEITRQSLCEERKNILHVKASKCLKEIVAIIQELKSIVERENPENTPLKSLLLNAGVEAMSDTRATRYRQMVTKCLDQAEILENALRTIVTITVGDGIPSNADSICSSIRCINFFE